MERSHEHIETRDAWHYRMPGRGGIYSGGHRSSSCALPEKVPQDGRSLGAEV